METQITNINDDLFNELKHSIDTEAQPANEEEFRMTECKPDGVIHYLRSENLIKN